MGMTPREIWLAKCALKTLDNVGPAGLSEEALFEQAGIHGQTLLTRIEKQATMKRLVDNGWVNRYTDALTGNIRWTISEDGRLALGAL